MTISREEVDQKMRDEGIAPMTDVLASHGITPEFLAKQLKRELKAKETKFFKIKKGGGKKNKVLQEINAMLNGTGLQAEELSQKGVKIITETGEEQLVAIDVKNLTLQQRAREDAQKLLGLYPAEKRELSGPGGGPIRVTDLTDEELYDIIKAGSGDRTTEKAEG